MEISDTGRVHRLHDLMIELGRLELRFEQVTEPESERMRLQEKQQQLRQAIARLTD